MAKTKSRLGRGLESLIAGSISKPADPARSPQSKKAAGKAPAKGSAKASRKKKAAPPKAKETAPPASTRQTPPEAKLEGTIPLPPKPGAETLSGMREVPIKQVVPNPHQPRKDFEPHSLAELAESIRSEGLLQPVVVRAVGDQFQLIAGERRWRACQVLKMKRIPIRIIEATESSSAVMSLIENLQREDLNPIEEALGYASLMSDFKLTQEAVSERVGKARASIANSLRLLQLDAEIQQFISKKMLSVGHAKVLLGLESPDERNLVARQVIERQLSVRETEKLVQQRRRGGSLTSKPAAAHTSPAESAAVADLEKRLTQSLSTRVQVKHSAKKGRIMIEYYGNEDLQRILDCFGITL